jgi:DNA-binding protein WhiA
VSFSHDVKRELAVLVPQAAHCRQAQLSGLLFGAGTFEISAGGHYAVRLSFSLPAVARHALTLLRPYHVAAQVRTVSGGPVGRRYEVVLDDREAGLQVLNETGVLSDALRLQLRAPSRLLQRRCCVVAFVRGMFLGCGSISAPSSPVHLEFTLEDRDLAEQLVRLLERLDLRFGVAARARNIACYTKSSETANALLAVLGAHDAALRREEHAVLGGVRERANRLANCDQANARRAATAGERQADAARRLMADPSWAGLPPTVKEVAELRLRYPFLSLQELGGRTRPPLGKSALNHRLRRLMAAADELDA